MAEITTARSGQYLRKLFEVLIQHPEGLQAREALGKVRAALTLSEYENGTTASGANRFEKTLRFHTVDAVKADWLVKHKGIWTVTEVGRQAYRRFQDPEAFYREGARLYREWAKSQPDVAEPEPAEEPSAEKSIRINYEQAEEQAWAEVEDYLRGMPPFEFQDLVADLLKAMGYHIAWKSPPGKDGGIDIVAYNDPLGTRPPRIKVQVKRYGSKIDVNGLRSFMALLGDSDVGLFVTTSGFTRDAEDEARKQEVRKVTLINLERFFDLWVEHLPKLDDAARRRFPLQPIYFLAPGN